MVTETWTFFGAHVPSPMMVRMDTVSVPDLPIGPRLDRLVMLRFIYCLFAINIQMCVNII